MRVAIVGGKLQGVEAAYLARKAGWQTVLIDRSPEPQASGLCDESARADISDIELAKKVLTGVDLIIPALEDRAALAALEQLEAELGCPIAFDFPANALSSSKAKSHLLFDKLGLTSPKPFPQCGFPLLVKPDGASGSEGVAILADEAECERFFGQPMIGEGWVGQQFISGPSYSLEVIGRGGCYTTPQITELHMDQGFDCKAVTAPPQLSAELAAELRKITLQLAEALNLSGIMDVEVIAHDDRLYLLEIDARLPSQTPIAVYWSCGINMLESLAQVYLPGTCSSPGHNEPEVWVRLEHMRVESKVLTLAGEHLMAKAGPLSIRENFFDVREAVTDYQPGKENWSATLIHIGSTQKELEDRREMALAAIKAGCNIQQIIDSGPSTVPGLGVTGSHMS